MTHKNIFIFFLGVILFSSFNHVKYNASNDYKKSSPNDPSFEARLSIHEDEFSALDNYYELYASEKNVGNIYRTIYSNLLVGGKEQAKFMLKNNISFNNFRLTVADVKKLTKGEKSVYYSNLNLVCSKYKMTDTEFDEISRLINIAKNDASFNLKSSLELYQKYLGLAKKLNYSKLEIIEDATGYFDFSAFEANYKNPLSYSTERQQGLESNEAIRKLSDLLQDLSPLDVSIYPNPFVSTMSFEIFCEDAKNIQITIFDSQGRKIRSLYNEIPDSGHYFETSWDGSDQRGNHLPSGIYIYKVKNYLTNSEVSNTVVLN